MCKQIIFTQNNLILTALYLVYSTYDDFCLKIKADLLIRKLKVSSKVKIIIGKHIYNSAIEAYEAHEE